MKRDAYIYAKLCVSKYGIILLPVVYGMLNLLVPTRCSIVIDTDVQNETIETNPWCGRKEAYTCPLGTHVLCMYNETKFGSRCIDPEIVPLAYQEREFIRQIFNGFKRELSKGFTVLGKNNVPLPRANEMHALHWDFTFQRMAQAWANQCNPTTTDLCRDWVAKKRNNTMFTPRIVFQRVGQMVCVFRFNYPDWTHPDYKFDNVGGPEPTVEKVRYAIKEIARHIYNQRKLVTPEIIRNYTIETEMNPYLLMIYGSSGRFGCAMTKYLDYMVGEDLHDTHKYYALLLVCNNSFRPKNGIEVYKTDISKGTCTCKTFSTHIRYDDCLCSDMLDPRDHPIEPEPPKCIKPDPKGLSGRRPAVVLMPIVAVEDGDPNTQNKRVAVEELKQKLQLRQKIKDRVEMVRDRYFKNYFLVDPGTRFPNNGPIDNNTFILFRPETMKPELKYSTKRKRHTIKPRKDFSNVDHLVSEYLAHKRQFISHFATDIAPYNDRRRVPAATVTPIENYQNFQRVSTRDYRYGIRGTPKQNSKDFQYNKNVNNMVQKNINYIPRTYNNFLRPSKHIRKGDLMNIILPINIEHGRNNNGEKRNKFSRRNQNPLRIPASDRNNFEYNRPFENGYGNVEYDNPPGMLINPDYDDGLQNGDDYLDNIASGDNRGLKRLDSYGANKISSYLDRQSYRRPLKHYDKKVSRFNQRRRTEVNEPHSPEQRYLMPDRLNYMREL